MSTRNLVLVIAAISLAFLLGACQSPNPQPPGLTAIPSLAPAQTPTLVPALQGGAAAPGPVAAGKPDGAAGAPIYLEHCSPCHGLQGEGGIGPALRNSTFIQTAGDPSILSTIAGGRPGTVMPAWLRADGGPLMDAEINNVTAYLKSLQNVPPLPRAATPTPEPTEAPPAAGGPTPEPARPSGEGGPGSAVNLTGNAGNGKGLFGQYCAACHGPEGVIGLPNPDSDDGAVPAINPIDPSIASSDPKTFATNLDLFIEHGSVPAGPSPLLAMPAFGDGKLLTPQQIADLIAYVISVNSGK